MLIKGGYRTTRDCGLLSNGLSKVTMTVAVTKVSDFLELPT